MAFGIGTNSVTEGQLAIIGMLYKLPYLFPGIHLTLYFYGLNSFWSKDIAGYLPAFITGNLGNTTLEFKYAFIGFVVLLMNGLAIFSSVMRVINYTPAKDHEKPQSKLTALLQQLPNITLTILTEILIRKTSILQEHPRTLVYMLALLEILIIVCKNVCINMFRVPWYSRDNVKNHLILFTGTLFPILPLLPISLWRSPTLTPCLPSTFI